MYFYSDIYVIYRTVQSIYNEENSFVLRNEFVKILKVLMFKKFSSIKCFQKLNNDKIIRRCDNCSLLFNLAKSVTMDYCTVDRNVSDESDFGLNRLHIRKDNFHTENRSKNSNLRQLFAVCGQELQHIYPPYTTEMFSL